MEENIKIASDAEPNSLTEEEINITKEVSKIFSGLMKVPCTACQYCMPCPQGINIPHSFTLYNVKHLFNKGLKNRIQYLKLHGGVMDKKPELASQCINCGKCVKHCPQHIDIPAELKNVSKTYEGIIGKPLTFIIDKAMRIGSSKEKK